MRGRRPRRPGDGRVANKLRDLLEKEGFVVNFFMPALGHWRKHSSDVHAWEAQAEHQGRTVTLCCWATMTECVSMGIAVTPDSESNHYFDVDPNSPTDSAKIAE